MKILKKAFDKYNWQWTTNNEEDIEKYLSIKIKNNMYLYNYRNSFKYKDDCVLNRCRGLVIDNDGNILNYPFDRFFNHHEKECCLGDIDWDSAEGQEKLDGSLICVFWNGVGWEITTRGSFYDNDNDNKEGFGFTNFAQLFRKHFNNFDLLNKDYSYMFELITFENVIIKKYREEMVHLIGGRNLITLQEISQVELDNISKIIGAKRPKRYFAKDFNSFRKLFEKDGEFEKDDEGIVIVDKYFNRIKLKRKAYMKIAQIKMLSEQDMFDYILGKKEIDEGLINDDKEIQKMIENIRQGWNNIYLNLCKDFNQIIEQIRDKRDRKSFALLAKQNPFSGILFGMLDGKDIKKLKLNWATLQKLNTRRK